MPANRPVKRSGDADDVAEDDQAAGPKVKLPRLDRGPEEFSSVVKSKLQSYTRTGQACDRCKVRKIRCDALPEGCSHCANQSLACYVTDRVTGRTERRGYLQELEREKNDMLAHIHDLEKLLDTHGVEVRPWQWNAFHRPSSPGTSVDAMGNRVRDAAVRSQWTQAGTVWFKKAPGKSVHQTIVASHRPRNSYAGHSALLQTRPADSHLGLSSDKSLLSSIKGTTLSILGTAIDITSFELPDQDEPPPGTPPGSPLYNKSLMAFLQSIARVNPPLENVELPSRNDAFTYCEWYFVMIHPFTPVLHKPSFLSLLTRIYDDNLQYKASVEELVIVHMVFAQIYFQYGIRNREEPGKQAQLNELSNNHYHWCLNKFFDLAVSQTVTSVQALAMLAAHTRSFPKPGCSTMMLDFALRKAIELNLHRPFLQPDEPSNLENEIRKRLWWNILALLATLNGRLGRPMPLGLEDFDVDFPLAVPDECITENGILESTNMGSPTFSVGLAGYKICPLLLKMYSSIYSVRTDPTTYVDVVRTLQEQLRSYKAELPDELNVDKCRSSSQIFALYTQAFTLELQLCLRHPSVCMTDDPKFTAENTRICEETARELLKVIWRLYKIKSLDTTWYQLSVYVAAMFSMLVAPWERRFTITSHEIATLREEVTMWLAILAEIGHLLGTGPRLTNELSNIVDRTISWIENDQNRKNGATPGEHGMPSRRGPQNPAKSETPFSRPGQSSVSFKPQNHTGDPTTNGSGAPVDLRNGNGAGGTSATGGGDVYYDPSVGGAASGYPSQMSYAGQATAAQNGGTLAGSYDAPQSAQFLYASGASGAGSQVAAHNGQPDQSTDNPLIAFASQATQHVADHGVQGGGGADDWRSHMMAASATAAGGSWHDWAAAVAEDRYSANALLTLGGAGRAEGMAVGDGAQSDLGVGVGTTHAGQWPLLIFHDGGSGG